MKNNGILRPEVVGEMLKSSGLIQKILFTIGIIIVFRIGIFIPVPGLDTSILQKLFNSGNLLGLIDMFSGGALSSFSILAMGIVPYINASIIIQLMTSVIPKLEELQKEGGEAGRKQLAQITRYLTIVLGTLQSTGIVIALWRSNAIIGHPAASSPPILFILNTVLLLVAGTIFIMWLGEQITEKGIGNGASILIFIGIISRFPSYFKSTMESVEAGATNWFSVSLLLLIFLSLIIAIVYASEGARKIPVQSAKRQVGNKMYGGRATYLPFRINQGGVMPIIFASSVLLFPATISQFVSAGWLKTITDYLNPSKPLYPILYCALIFFFTFFYASITLNPIEIANNLKRYGSFIPGYRPGRPTAEYLETILNRITLLGALFISSIALIPMIAERALGVNTLSGLGSTALLIMVGVAIDLFNQLQAHLLARQYEGFLK
ncbi:MAG: protein translocase subunit SecY [Candidatus Sericytochromatia bacterium]|nr:MAG: protein translocase subunit SecY [Candidatus Sericytochromatia bacterium]